MTDTDITRTIAALNTLVREHTIQALSDLEWWTLAGIIALWLRDPKSRALRARVRRNGLSKADTIASVIALIARGYLKLEVSYPEETLEAETIRDCARLGYRISVPETAPDDEPRVSTELSELIWSKLEVFADAEKHVRKGQRPGRPRRGS